MKKYTALLAVLIILPFLKGQVVFCPPGAAWHYTIRNQAGGHPYYSKIIKNAAAAYVRDTVLDGSSAKILVHDFFYVYCDDYDIMTLIRQSGDTIFMKNKYTDSTWQVLFNFATTPGDYWTTTVRSGYSSIGSHSYSVTVDSIKMIQENSIPLKQLFVTYRETNASWMTYTYTSVITERWGGQRSLFNFNEGSLACDGPLIETRLCYEDDDFPSITFSSLPCDFANPLGIDEAGLSGINIYPVPVTNELNISAKGKICSLLLTDLRGRLLLASEPASYTTTIDMGGFPKGFYILHLKDWNNRSYYKKIIMD